MSPLFLNWWYTLLVMLETNRIATAALDESWLQVRSKAAMLSAAERAEYLPIHVALVVQQHVDKLVWENPAMPSSLANRLIVKATERVVRRLLGRLGNAVGGTVLGAH